MLESKEENRCSFCHRPRRLALHLVTGPRGRNICDLCILEARSRTEEVETGPWGANCSFCGRSVEEASLKLLVEETGICGDCVESSHRMVERVVGPGAEFLHEEPSLDHSEKFSELLELGHTFEKHFLDLQKSFEKDEIDWQAHNIMAQTIPPLKSKAGIIGLEKVSDLMWEIESLFRSIHFDDVEKNRPSVQKLAEFVERLVETIEAARG